MNLRDTELHTWFERDRAHVELRHTETQKTLVEWWDEDVYQAIEDGFLPLGGFVLGRLSFKSRLHQAAFDYYMETRA